MINNIQKSGRKIKRRLSRFSRRASEEGKEHLRENLVDRISHVRDVRLLVLEWVLLVLVVILLSATQALWYSNSYSISSFKKGGTYTEATLGKVNSLNPLFASTNSEKVLSKLLFASLAENDYSGHPGASLASMINSDDEGKNWTVRLRDGLKWSDGEPLTNEDVFFTIGLIKNPKISTAYASSLIGASVTEDENGNIVFSLASPYVDFRSALDFPILPKHVLKDISPSLLLESDFSQTPVSSGPFMFNATQPIGVNGETVVYLSSNPNFYRGEPMLKSFAVHAFLDKKAIISAINSGTVTATAELSSKDGESLRTDKFYERHKAINSGVFAFLNTSSSLLSNKTLRQAIQQGINTETLREIAKTDSKLEYPFLESQVNLNGQSQIPEYNLDAAKAAVSELGLESPFVSIATINENELPEVAENFASQLRELGLNAEVSVYEPSQDFVLNVVGARAYDILIYDVELGTSPDIFSYYHSSQANSSGLNFSNYKNSIVDDLILATRSTSDETLKNAKYNSFARYWVADVPSIALYQSNLVYFYNKNVRAFSEDLKITTPIDIFTEVEYWAVEKTSLNRTP